MPRADRNTAAGLGRRPLFPLLHTVDSATLPQAVVEETDWSYNSHIGATGQEADAIKTLFGLLRQRTRAEAYGLDASDRNVRAILDSAGHLILDHIEDEPVTAEQWYLRTLLLAGHIFTYSLLWASGAHPVRGPLVQIMLRRLLKSLSAAREPAVRDLWRTHAVALLWVLFVGAATTVEDKSGRGEGFLLRLRVVCKWLRCETRAKFEEHLRAMVWDGIFGRVAVDRLWDGPDRPTQQGVEMQSFVRTFVI